MKDINIDGHYARAQKIILAASRGVSMKILLVMNFIVLLSAVSEILLACSSVQSSFAIIRPTGKIAGTVVDPNGAVIPNATVIIKGEQTTEKLLTDTNGAYEAELPCGVYEISTEIPGWYPLRRAKFYVEPKGVILLTLAPALQTTSIGLEITSSGIREPVTTIPSPQYETLRLPEPLHPQLEILVQFLKRRMQKHANKYNMAIVSYNQLTISADELFIDSNTFRIKARGKVVIENGKELIHAKSVDVEFKAGMPVIDDLPRMK